MPRKKAVMEGQMKINDEAFMSPEEMARQREIQKQKAKRKQRQVEQEESIKRQKQEKKQREKDRKIAQKKKLQAERDAVKKKREQQKKAVKRQKTEQKKQIRAQKKAEVEKYKQQRAREKRIQDRNKKQRKQDANYEVNAQIRRVEAKTGRKITKKEYELYQKQQRDKLKKRKRAKRILTTIVLLAILAGGAVFAFTSPLFNIKEIKVEGISKVPEDTVKSLSGLQEGNNIFRFLKFNTENSIKREPYVESVEISRELPNTVKITVQERQGRFSVAFLNSYAIISTQGYILEISEDSQGFPILAGTSTPPEEIEAGKRLNNEDLEQLETVIKIMNILKDNNLQEAVTKLEITDTKEFVLYMDGENKKVYIGDKSNLNNKIIYVQAIVNDTKGREGEIFVNGDLNNKFKPYFREKV